MRAFCLLILVFGAAACCHTQPGREAKTDYVVGFSADDPTLDTEQQIFLEAGITNRGERPLRNYFSRNRTFRVTLLDRLPGDSAFNEPRYLPPILRNDTPRRTGRPTVRDEDYDLLPGQTSVVAANIFVGPHVMEDLALEKVIREDPTLPDAVLAGFRINLPGEYRFQVDKTGPDGLRPSYVGTATLKIHASRGPGGVRP